MSAAPFLYIQWQDKHGIAVIREAIQSIADTPRAHAALRRAINHTGNKTFTRVRREVARVSSVPQKVLMAGDDRGGPRLLRRPASGGHLQYTITGSGKPIRIKHFAPRFAKKGFAFRIWQQNKTIKSAFWIGEGAKWGTGLKKDGNFYVRAGKKRFPLHSLWGATVSKEIIKNEVVTQFHAVVGAELPKRALHEIRWISKGAFT